MILDELTVPVDVHYLSIDSRKRDRFLFPDASRYVVDFDRVFKDIVSVELVYALYGKFGDEDYVNLYIEELVPNMVSNCTRIGGSFTQLPLLQPKNEYTSASKFRSVKVYPTPLNKLAKFHVSFMGFDGSLYPIREHMMRFEITTLKFHMKRAVLLTRDAIKVWMDKSAIEVADATNVITADAVTTLTNPANNMQSRPLTDADCVLILGLRAPFNLQDVKNAYKARKASVDSKRAFKILCALARAPASLR